MKYTFDYISKQLREIIEPATRQSHKFDAVLGCRSFHNAFVAPYVGWTKSIGCVIDASGQEVKDSGCIEWKEDAAYYNTNDSLEEHKRVVFLGFLLTVFGHSYTDDLRKLWFLQTEEYKLLRQKGYEVVYTTSWNRPIPQPVLDIIRLAGFDLDKACHVTQLTRFEEVVIPDNCFKSTSYGRIYSQEYTEMIDRIKQAIPSSKDGWSKVYFTRTSFTSNSKKEYGEQEIEQVFERMGYTIVAPEAYSVIEQIQMVQHCTHFASTEGSVSHLSLFCQPGTEVAIINKASYLNFHQVLINEFADLNVTYIEANHSSRANPEYPWWGPFYLCVNRHMERFVHHPILHLPYWLKFSYWEYTRNVLYRIYNRTRKAVKWVRSSQS